MGFIESYKHLEKICGEVLNDDRCISAYIDEMLNTPVGFILYEVGIIPKIAENTTDELEIR